MKTTKKILSIVLAVMLLVGTVVVGVSADTTMVFEKAGSKLVYTATADKTTTDEEGYILVQPGDDVTVSVYMQANYYLGTTGSEIFAWSTNFFEDVTLSTDISRHNFINYYNPVNNKLVAEKAAQLGAPYSSGGYVGYLFGRGYNTEAEVKGPYDASSPVLAYQFKFTVASTTADGATAEFVMPEPCSATVATNSRMRQIYASVNNSATAFGSSSQASQYPETIDLTGTLLKFKVGSADVACNYKDLNDAIAQYETDLADKALYTTDSWADYEAAYTAATKVPTDLVVDAEGANQATIDAATKALTDAKAGLDLLEYCSYTLLETAVNYCSELDAEEDYYDPTDLATWKAALAEAEALLADKDSAPLVLTDENQAKLDNAAQALQNAYDELYEIYVDLRPLTEAIDLYDTPEKSPEFYDVAKYEAWQLALANARDGLYDFDGKPGTEANNAAVAALAANLKNAYEGLEENYVDLTALTKAVADYAAPKYAAEYYDATEYAVYEAALSAAQKGLTDYAGKADTAANREAVAALAADLKDAFEALDARFVNTEALDKAVADYAAPAYAAEYYDADEYAAWQAAFKAADEAEFAEAADTETNRAAVAKLAADLKDAFEALDARFVDYSALENAVAAYGTTPEAADAYTTETYEPYAAALAAAKDMLANKKEAPASDTALTAEIAAAAANLETTFKALELAPVTPSLITSVVSTQEHYKVGDTVKFNYVCSVTNVTKIQLIFSDGSTTTYHRGHSAVSVKDNGDGTETWTIATKIYKDEYTVTARAKLGKVWEENGFKYEVKTSSDEDFSVKSAEVLLDGVAVTEYTTDDTVVLKIVCGPNTKRMRLVDQSNGATQTFSRTKATQDENSNWVWLITRKSAAGQYAYDIYTTGSSNKLTDEGTDLAYTVKAPVVVNGPSTGNDADIVKSATVEKARVMCGNTVTVTVVTDKNAKGVRVNQNGTVHGYNKDTASAVVEGDTLVWTITYRATLAGTYNCAVEALYGNQWMANGTSISYRVIY